MEYKLMRSLPGIPAGAKITQNVPGHTQEETSANGPWYAVSGKSVHPIHGFNPTEESWIPWINRWGYSDEDKLFLEAGKKTNMILEVDIDLERENNIYLNRITMVGLPLQWRTRQPDQYEGKRDHIEETVALAQATAISILLAETEMGVSSGTSLRHVISIIEDVVFNAGHEARMVKVRSNDDDDIMEMAIRDIEDDYEPTTPLHEPQPQPGPQRRERANGPIIQEFVEPSEQYALTISGAKQYIVRPTDEYMHRVGDLAYVREVSSENIFTGNAVMMKIVSILNLNTGGKWPVSVHRPNGSNWSIIGLQAI